MRAIYVCHTPQAHVLLVLGSLLCGGLFLAFSAIAILGTTWTFCVLMVTRLVSACALVLNCGGERVHLAAADYAMKACTIATYYMCALKCEQPVDLP